MHDELQDRGQTGHAVVARRIGHLIQGGHGELNLVLGAQLAGQAEGGGDRRRVRGPHDAVEAQRVEAQVGRIIGDVIPDAGLILESIVGQIRQRRSEVGAGAGDGGVDKRGF